MTDKESFHTITAQDVLLYIPNLIGYTRVLCSVISFILMLTLPRYWLLAIVLYIASFVGDLFGKNRLKPTKKTKYMEMEFENGNKHW
jgi:hypothetical protein